MLSPALIRNSPITNSASPLAQTGLIYDPANQAESSLVGLMQANNASNQDIMFALSNLRIGSGPGNALGSYMPTLNGKFYVPDLEAWVDLSGQISSPPILGSDIQRLGTQFSGGNFPTTPQLPNTIMYKLDSAGNITNYQIWGNDGLPVYRVDLTGASHNLVPAPHSIYWDRNSPSPGSVFSNNTTDAIQSNPLEIP